MSDGPPSDTMDEECPGPPWSETPPPVWTTRPCGRCGRREARWAAYFIYRSVLVGDDG